MSKKVIENKTGLSIGVLIENVKCEDLRKRVFAINNLNVVASALGPERTRLELIPYLSELCGEEEEEEIQQAVAENLPKLAEFVGGVQHVILLLPQLEALCKSEEPVVRRKAAAGIAGVVKISDFKKNEEVLSAMFKRLSEGTTSEKVLLVSIISAVYSSVTDRQRTEFNAMYALLSRESSVAIRSEVSKNLKEFISVMTSKQEETVLKIIHEYMVDQHESVRMYLVDSCILILKAPPVDWPHRAHAQSLHCLKLLAEDKSWRVKFYLCQQLAEVSASVGQSEFRKIILPNYFKYLDDSEVELRGVAAQQIAVVGGNLESEEIVAKIVPILRILVVDQQSSVRNQIAGSFLGLSAHLGKKQTIDILLPLLLQLLKDEDSEVRVSMFKSLNQIATVIGIDALSQSVLPALAELAVDKNWRIRASAVDIITYFAKDIGADFVGDKVQKILFELLEDKVSSVREVVIAALKQVMLALGWQWSERSILTRVIALKDSPNYLQRETFIFIVVQCYKQLNADYLSRVIVPALIAMSKDQVANVRFNIAKCFKAIAASLKERENVRRVLGLLGEDLDVDVRYYAKQALEAL